MGKNFSFSKATSQLLPQFLDMPNSLKLTHKGKRYVLFVAYFCKEVEANGKYFLIDHINGNIIEKYEWFNESKSLKELLAEIKL